MDVRTHGIDGGDAIIEVGGRRLPLRLRVNPRARRIVLTLGRRAPEVIVTTPPHVGAATALAFVHRQRDWIDRQLRRLPAPVPFRNGAEIPYRGEMHRIVHVPGRRGTVWREDSPGGRRICVAGDGRHLSRRLKDWLKARARHHLAAACREHAAAMGVRYRRLGVRDQVSRWGSCSVRGTLSFSWRLILAPPFVLDYLAAHEVAHLRHMDHSPAFWALVRDHCSHVDAAERWLREHGRGLHAWGVSPLGSEV